MGKAGEKQKRRPKIKDRRQSERFKETAREIGADKDDGSVERIIKEMAKALEPKYIAYRHKIYNARFMMKPVETPFPSLLVADEWKPIAKMTKGFQAALRDIKAKGFHECEQDMSQYYDVENASSRDDH